MSSGVESAPTLYHNIAPAARAASYSRLTLGRVAWQRGRVLHDPPLVMSRMSKAVVEPSSVTGFSSGAGGGFTVAQSSMMSVAEYAAKAIMSAPTSAVAQRNRARLFNTVPPLVSPYPGVSRIAGFVSRYGQAA